MVVLKNSLGKKMSRKYYERRKGFVEYSNHSIRATTITILDTNRYEERNTMPESGHKSESSLKSYASKGELTRSKMAAIGSSEHDVAETQNARSPNKSALTTIQAKEIDLSLF